jgi:hypothetical protein
MPQIFISYRRSDSPDVIGRIYDVLAESFGAENVFRDLDSIPVGTPFPSFLEETLGNTDVVLVVIGPDWLHVRNAEGQRRLDDPDDFVRIEVETALRLGVPVVPVLVSNSRMPGHAELPEPIRGLVLHNGLAVRPDPDFHTDMARLINRLEELLGRIPAHRRDVRTRVQSLEHNRELLQLELDWSQTRERYRRDPKNGCFLAAIAVFYVLCRCLVRQHLAGHRLPAVRPSLPLHFHAVVLLCRSILLLSKTSQGLSKSTAGSHGSTGEGHVNGTGLIIDAMGLVG